MKNWELWTCPACGGHEWEEMQDGDRRCPFCGAQFSRIGDGTEMFRPELIPLSRLSRLSCSTHTVAFCNDDVELVAGDGTDPGALASWSLQF